MIFQKWLIGQAEMPARLCMMSIYGDRQVFIEG